VGRRWLTGRLANRFTPPESGDRNVYVNAFLSAQAECRKLGVR
jgi:hypothetical protein